jgi:hypothetical protein
MSEEDDYKRANTLIRLVGQTLPPGSHIKVHQKDGETWFCFHIEAEWGGTIRGCLNPRQAVSRLITRLLADAETATARRSAIWQAESTLRQLLANLPQDVADFIHAIFNKASHMAIQKASSALARELRISGDPHGLLPQVEELADFRKPVEELSKWLFELQMDREKITGGQKGSRLTRSEVIEARNEYKQILARFREIKKDHNQEKKAYGKRPEIRRGGFKLTHWKKEWKKTCAERADYQDLPENILALFVTDAASSIAAKFVSARFRVSSSYFSTHILPLAKKLQENNSYIPV